MRLCRPPLPRPAAASSWHEYFFEPRMCQTTSLNPNQPLDLCVTLVTRLMGMTPFLRGTPIMRPTSVNGLFMLSRMSSSYFRWSSKVQIQRLPGTIRFLSTDDCNQSKCSNNAPRSATGTPGQANLSRISITDTKFWSCKHTARRAAKNTSRCLVGCSVGDYLALITLQTYYPNIPMWTTMSIAMMCGISSSLMLETVLLKWQEGFEWKNAFTAAFGMSFVSMFSMELAANATEIYLTGGCIDLNSTYFWASLGVSTVAGFITPLPYNYYMIRRHGKSCH